VWIVLDQFFDWPGKLLLKLRLRKDPNGYWRCHYYGDCDRWHRYYRETHSDD
jgi:hypothetical protein